MVQSTFSRLGYLGVAIFSVISGFLLYPPFVLAHFEDRPGRVYLWHAQLWFASFDWAGDGAIPKGAVSEFLVVLALTLAAATASYFLVERPVRSWVQHVTHSRPARSRNPEA